MSHDPDPRQRLTDLLADRATQGLTPREQQELEAILREAPDAPAVAADYDRLEGALVAAAHASEHPLPPDLRATLLTQGLDAVRNAAPGSRAGPTPAGPDLAPISLADHRARIGAPRGVRAWAVLGWVVAAAALAIAAIAWWPGGAAGPGEPSPAQRRAALEIEAPDAVTVALDATDDPAASGVAGDIVWSNARQEGYLRLRGIAPNDPAVAQFQLWIYDHTRDDQHPVPAGVFDVAQADIDPITRELILPIRAALPIGRARGFAVTLERPGGVVVTDRSRLVLSGVI